MKIRNVFLTVVISLFILSGFVALDPDFGYRVRGGAMYFLSGIPKTDPFSYTMPSFPWVDHAWLTTFAIGLLYSLIGKFGLSVFFSVLAVLAFFISASSYKPLIKNVKTRFNPGNFLGVDLGYFGYIPFVLGLSIIFSAFGIRVQVVTWLALSLFIKFVYDKRLWERYYHYLPLFFLIWANFHGGYISGLAIFCVILVVRTINKSVQVGEVISFTASVFATLVNPYGLGNWREVWSSISDTSLRWQVNEWMPAIFNGDLAMTAYITLFLVMVPRYRSKFSLDVLLINFLFLAQAILSRRHLQPWVVVSLPVLLSTFFFFYQEIVGIKTALYRFNKVYKIGFVLFSVLALVQILISFYGNFFIAEGIFYPKRAVEYLRVNQPSGNVFSMYGWGGYLIWKYPEKKVFVDGRMPSWKWDKAPLDEEKSAFELYLDILSGEEDFRKAFDKYNIDTVLIGAERKETLFDKLQEKLDNLIKKFRQDKKRFNFVADLEKDGWEKVFEDNVSRVYKNQL